MAKLLLPRWCIKEIFQGYIARLRYRMILCRHQAGELQSPRASGFRRPQTDPSPCVFGCGCSEQKTCTPCSPARSTNDRFASVPLGPVKIPFGLQRVSMWLGFRCYSKKVLLSRKVSLRRNLGSSCLLSLLGFSLSPSLSFPPSLSLSLRGWSQAQGGYDTSQ